MLRKIEQVAEIRRVWRSIEREMRSEAQREIHTLGAQIRADKHNLIIRDDLGIWCAPSVERNGRLWFPFGTLPLKPSGNISMTVQINPAVSRNANGVGGLLAEDEAGDRWICHTGRLGGSRSGFGRKRFLRWTDRQPIHAVDSQDRKSSVFPVARVGANDMLWGIAEYVREVADFKARRQPPAGQRHSGPFGGSEDELEESVHIAARAGYRMTRLHGIIRNRLRDLLKRAGLGAFRDAQRDLVIGNRKAPGFEFEIKPCADLQSVYTAVGQLLLHNTIWPAKRRVAVLPEQLDPKRAAAIRSLGIDILTFQIGKTHVEFSNLSDFVPQAAVRAPL